VPLSVFCSSKLAYVAFLVVVNPLASLAAAVHTTLAQRLQQQQQQQEQGQCAVEPVAAAYRRLLLEPQHWFAIWRHNCLLVSAHALVSGSSSYALEAKGAFLAEGQRLGLPVTPHYSDAAAVFVKHVAVEGGMGIHRFRCGQVHWGSAL
jgi:hypothetical protein